MFIIHPLATHADEVADFQRISMEPYISKAHSEGIFCVLYILKRITYFYMYIYRISDIFSTLNTVSPPHDACGRDIGISEGQVFTTQVVEISDFLKTSTENITFSYHVGENYTMRANLTGKY